MVLQNVKLFCCKLRIQLRKIKSCEKIAKYIDKHRLKCNNIATNTKRKTKTQQNKWGGITLKLQLALDFDLSMQDAVGMVKKTEKMLIL